MVFTNSLSSWASLAGLKPHPQNRTRISNPSCWAARSGFLASQAKNGDSRDLANQFSGAKVEGERFLAVAHHLPASSAQQTTVNLPDDHAFIRKPG